jgi:hypothetical protein
MKAIDPSLNLNRLFFPYGAELQDQTEAESASLKAEFDFRRHGNGNGCGKND